MVTLQKTAITLFALALTSLAPLANAATDRGGAPGEAAPTAPSGSYSTEATDRGGKSAPVNETLAEFSLPNWLRGLMD